MPHSDSRAVSTDQDDQETHSFLLMAAESLHRYGTPSYRLEGVMEKVAESLNVPSVFLYTPTALVIALGKGTHHETYVRRVESADVDISRLLAVDATLEELEQGTLTIRQAKARLQSVAQWPAIVMVVVTAFIASRWVSTIAGVEVGAFSMSIVGVALVGGLLLANQLISPKRIL